MRVVNTSEMRKIENLVTEKLKFGGSLMVENVGVSGANILEETLLKDFDVEEIVILVGQGNNGADALAIGRQLCNRGYSVRCILIFSGEDMGEVVKKQLDLAYDFGCKVTEIKKADELESFFSQTQSQRLVIDGIIGSGLRLPLPNQLFDMVNVINKHSYLTVAIDVATGICSDTGALSGNAIEADATLSIGLPKTGHFIGDGAVHSGNLMLVDAGLPQHVLEGGNKFLLGLNSLTSFYEKRSVFAHKNTFGHTLVVGGSDGMTGAVMLSANAALNVGSGLVTATTWEKNYPEMCSRIQAEVITGHIPGLQGDQEQAIKELSSFDAIIVGPGLGRGEKARDVVLKILNHFAGPVVVDADALRVLDIERDHELLTQRKSLTVLTPHIGEFSDFVGADKKSVLENPLVHLKTLTEKTTCCVLLKGAASYLGLPNGEMYINYSPNDGMATAGSGDVLSGILGGLLAGAPKETRRNQLHSDQESYFNALKLGLVIHSIAGDQASKEVGTRSVTAGLISNSLGLAFAELDEYFYPEE